MWPPQASTASPVVLPALRRVPFDRLGVRRAGGEVGELVPVGNGVSFEVVRLIPVDVAVLPGGAEARVGGAVSIRTLVDVDGGIAEGGLDRQAGLFAPGGHRVIDVDAAVAMNDEFVVEDGAGKIGDRRQG